MHALVFEEKGRPVRYREWDDPVSEPNKILVSLKAAALNHRDVFITKGLYPKIVAPAVLGSDGAGTLATGEEVLINPNINWGDNSSYQSAAYEVLGMPSQGTFADYIAVPRSRLAPKPAHLTWEEASALPLAGLTAYRALFTQGRLHKGQKVLITGAGGGVALFAIQFALAAEAEVWVSSGSDAKLARCQALGVLGGVNYRDSEWHKTLARLAGEFDLIIDSAGGEGFGFLLRLAKAGGRLVTYGGSRGVVPNFSPQLVFWKQLTILGSTMGTDEEFGSMVRFVDSYRIHPVIDEVFALRDGAHAFDRMDQGLQFGKIILVP